MTEPTEIPKGFWQAADGSLMPDSKVKPIDKARDALVKKLMEAAIGMSNDLADFKRLAMSEVQQFMDLSASQYGYTFRGTAGKGNVALVTYDGLMKVERANSDRIAFDERLEIAKGIFDDFVLKAQKGSSDVIKALLATAFRPDKAGNVSVAALMKLRRADIKDPQWQEGVKALDDCMRVDGTVPYLRFYRRESTEQAWQPVVLNASAA